MNQPQLARTYALEALQLRPDWGDPLILIGDIYAAENDAFDDDFERSTVYWAAVDKFIQAKSIDPEVVDPEDVEMLQDLIVAAVNEAVEASQNLAADAMGSITGGLNIPGLS